MKKIVCLLLSVTFLLCLSGCKEKGAELSTYDISVTLNEDMTLDCTMTYTFTPQKSIESVYFSLYPNAFSENAEISPVYKSDELYAYPNGKSYGKVEILKVKSAGKDLPFEVSGVNLGTLKVGFEQPINEGVKTSVFIEFKVTLANVKHRTGYGENTVNLSNFHPIACVLEQNGYYENVYYPNGDPFYSDVSNYKVRLAVPSSYVVASSLSPIKTEWSGGQTTYEYSRELVRDIAFILSKDFNVLEKSQDGVSVKYYYFSDKNPQNTLSTAVNSLFYFSDKYGKYPNKDYVVCEGDFLYGGMEYPCLSLISAEVTDDYRDYVVAHETAHQWFHGIVGFNESEIGFLDEGLAEFSTAYFMGKYKLENREYIDYINDAKNSYLSIKSSIDKVYGEKPPIMKRNLKQFRTNAEYVMISYNRSEVMIDSLYNYLGEKKFFKTVKKFVKEKAFKNANEEDFISAVEKKKRGAGNLLRSFIRGEREISL